MDSFELNKIAGAVLFACLLALGVGIFSEILFETEAPEAPGYLIAVAEDAGEAGGEAAAAEEPIAVLLASADVAAGESSFRKCAACHTADESGANKIGPGLYGVVNRPIAGHEGFAYSDAMVAFAEGGKVWDWENLNTFLHDPKGTVPGTKMSFAGLKNAQERGNVIAYLGTLAASPVPLPEVTAEAAAPAEGTAPADGAAPAEGTAPAAGAQAPSDTAPPTDGGQAPAPDSQPADQAPGEVAPMVPPAQQQPAPGGQSIEPADAAPAEAAPAEAAPAAPAEPAPAAPAQEGSTAPAPDAQQQAAAPAAEPVAAAAPASGFAALVATADLKLGETQARKCAVCHTFEKDGANKIGPHLYGAVGREIASVPDFSYSDAMKEFGAGKTWDIDTLDAYLANPKGVVPGTKMLFAGLKDEQQRAAVVAYMNSMSDNPVPAQ